MKLTTLISSILVGALVITLIAWGSALDVSYGDSGQAQLRLSWSARPERVESCRPISEEEQARLAPHMRRSVECVGEPASYLLVVIVDDDSLENKVIRGGGMRNDRPIHLLQDYPVSPGLHRVVVSMTRREAALEDSLSTVLPGATDADTGLFAGRAEREATERSRRNSSAIPAELLLDSTLNFAPSRTALVTFDADNRVLRLTTSSPTQR